jgi:tight adherence protein C
MEESSFQIILWSTAAGLSVACAVYVFLTTAQAGREEARRFRAQGQVAASPFFKMLRPLARATAFFVGGVSARVEMAVGRPAEKSFLMPVRIWAEKRLRSASYPEGVTADEFVGMMCLGGVFGLLAGVIANIRMQANPVILLFVAAGMYVPVMWLTGRLHRRQDDIRRALPYTLDMLTLSVEAGLDFTQALSRIVRKLGHGPLAVELGQTVRDIQLGRTRVQALRELSRRVDLSELNSITSALIQADELGSSLGPILRIQADQLRSRRSQAAEKLAMEAPVKILLPLILFIFPTIFIMIFGPIALKLLR